jgi:hypothetical protein
MDYTGFYADCRKYAVGHRVRRIERSKSQSRLVSHDSLVTIRGKDFELQPSIDGIEQSLIELGYQLRLLSTDQFQELASTVPVWLRRLEDHIEVQVCGQPYLHWEDDDEASALKGIVEAMHGFASDLRGSQSELSPPTARLLAFLNQVIRDD